MRSPAPKFDATPLKWKCEKAGCPCFRSRDKTPAIPYHDICHDPVTKHAEKNVALLENYFDGRKCRGYLMSRKSRFDSRNFGTKSRGYSMSRENEILKVTGTKCREVVQV